MSIHSLMILLWLTSASPAMPLPVERLARRATQGHPQHLRPLERISHRRRGSTLPQALTARSPLNRLISLLRHPLNRKRRIHTVVGIRITTIINITSKARGPPISPKIHFLQPSHALP